MKNPREERRQTSEIVSRIFGMVMVVLYITLGTTIIFIAGDIQRSLEGSQMHISREYLRLFGIVLILYAAFRAYKIYRRYYTDTES